MTLDPHNPATGIYYGVPVADYDACTAIRRTALVEGRKTASHIKWALEHGSECTEAMKFGTAAHMRLFEPEAFDAHYYDIPKLDYRKKANREIKAQLAESMPDREGIKEQDRQATLGMVDAIRHSEWGKALFATAKPEVTCIAEIDGVLLKVRLDCYAPGVIHPVLMKPENVVVDFKGTRKDGGAREWEFGRSIQSLSYFVQEAMYFDVAAAAGLPIDRFLFAVSEGKGPWAVQFHELTRHYRAIGRTEYRRYLDMVIHGRATGEWPGYPSKIIRHAPPTHMIKAGEVVYEKGEVHT